MDKLYEEVEKLKTENLGEVIAKGLAAVYKANPAYPIDYFSKWILNYALTQELEKEYNADAVLKEQLQKEYQIESNKQEILELENEKQIKEEKNIYIQLKEDIKNSQYPADFLETQIPNFLKEKLNLTGTYISHFDYLTKPVEETEENENAHIDISKPKILQYIGTSNNHLYLKGKVLKPEQGITNKLLQEKPKLSEQEKKKLKKKQLESGQPIPNDWFENDYCYVPDVSKEKSIHYWRFPRLGAYMAIPLFIEESLYIENFDKALQDKYQYKQKVKDQEKQRVDRTLKFEQDIENIQQNGGDQNEIDRVTSQYNFEISQYQEIPQPIYVTRKNQYIFSTDTLGQDKQLSEDDRYFLYDFIKYYKRCWEQTEKNQLFHDIDLQIEYLFNINKDEIFEEAGQLEDKLVQEQKEKEEELQIIKKEKETEEEQQEIDQQLKDLTKRYENVKLLAMRTLLLSEKYQNWILMLGQFNIIKHTYLIQTIFYFLGYRKEEINIPNSSKLDWRNTRHLISQQNFLGPLMKYDYKSPYGEEVPFYRKIKYIQERLASINQEEIDNFNIGLGQIIIYLEYIFTLRKEYIISYLKNNIKLRKEREQLIIDKQFRDQKRIDDLEVKKQSLTEEEAPEFNEEEWLQQFDTDNPEINIPDEIHDDLFNDMEIDTSELEEIVDPEQVEQQ